TPTTSSAASSGVRCDERPRTSSLLQGEDFVFARVVGAMSARNRELLGLIPASLLVTAGFTAVFVERHELLSNLSLTVGAWFLGLCLAAHFVIRFTLPYADPYLFPLVALLACFGLWMIYRIDHPLPARRVRQGRLRRLPGQLSARHAPGPRPGRAPVPRADDPAAQALRPAARRLGPGHAAAGHHPRPRLVADVLRRLPGAALRGDEPAVVRHRGTRAVRTRRLVLHRDGDPRPGPRRRLAAPVRPRALHQAGGRLVPDRPVDL